MRQARLAEVHLVVDGAGEDVQAGEVERLVHPRASRHAHVRDPSAVEEQVEALGASGKHDGGAAQERAHRGRGLAVRHGAAEPHERRKRATARCWGCGRTVSYTHLTLPTICSV